MTTDYAHLNTLTIPASDLLLKYYDLPKVVHLEDSAATVMSDFAHHAPLTFDKTSAMFMARRAMEARNIPFIFALDAEQQVAGFLSLKHILSEEPIKMIEEHRVVRSEVLIRHVMTPISEVPAIDRGKLELAKVGHILKTFEHERCEAVLVVESIGDKKSLRGIFLQSEVHKLPVKSKLGAVE